MNERSSRQNAGLIGNPSTMAKTATTNQQKGATQKISYVFFSRKSKQKQYQHKGGRQRKGSKSLLLGEKKQNREGWARRGGTLKKHKEKRGDGRMVEEQGGADYPTFPNESGRQKRTYTRIMELVQNKTKSTIRTQPIAQKSKDGNRRTHKYQQDKPHTHANLKKTQNKIKDTTSANRVPSPKRKPS